MLINNLNHNEIQNNLNHNEIQNSNIEIYNEIIEIGPALTAESLYLIHFTNNRY